MATEKRKIHRVIDAAGTLVQVLPETSAEQVTLADTAGNFTSNNVEGALAEVAEIAKNSGVTGVKGDAETAYRKGNVNITAANVGAEPAFTKNTAFNKNFGTSAGDVMEGNDTRVTTAVSDIAAIKTKNQSQDDEISSIKTKNTEQDTAIAGKANLTGGNAFTGDQSVTGSISTTGGLTVGGNLTVSGTTTTVDSTTLQVKDKLIEVAHGNTTKLTTPAGLVAPKYDGTNSGALVFDGDGIASVGDVVLDASGNIDVTRSQLQPLATRTGLVNDNLVKYDSANQTLVDSGKKTSDFATAAQGSNADSALSKANTNATSITNIVNGTTKVGKASSADSATNATNATNATSATNATNATNVTTNINGKAITSIFENDGTTVKKATSAGSATTAITASKLAHPLFFGTYSGSVEKSNGQYLGNKDTSILFSSDFSTAWNETTQTVIPNTFKVELKDMLTDVNPTAQYSAVKVDAKGRVTAGGKSIEWGTSGQTTPSANLMIGGLFMELQ